MAGQSSTLDSARVCSDGRCAAGVLLTESDAETSRLKGAVPPPGSKTKNLSLFNIELH